MSSLEEEFKDHGIYTFDCAEYQVDGLWEFIVGKVGEAQEKLLKDLQNARSERDALQRKVKTLEAELARLISERDS